MNCSQRFVLTLTVQNEQGATETITSYSLSTATDARGNSYFISDAISISLAKSQISLQYPLTYARDFNNKPYELAMTKDVNGNSFNWLTNPCVDSPTASATACGWVLNSTGQHIPNSQGFCCRCDLSDYVSGGSSSSETRDQLTCDLLSSANSQSAHCLRMDPLWYSAYAIGPAQVSQPPSLYRIDALYLLTGGLHDRRHHTAM
jgi:hypothetical protein